MNWKVNEICPIDIDNGIVVDYTEGSFVFLLKDDIWSEEELTDFKKHKMHLSFLYERVCAIFFLEVEDNIEVSDASFDIHLCDEQEHLFKAGVDNCYHVEVYLLDGKNKICAQRKVTLSKPSTKYIYECLKKQSETPYDHDGFDRALSKIQTLEQPFELVERCIVKEKFT